MKTVDQLEQDVRWWKDEVAARKIKVDEAERTLTERVRELESAVQADRMKQKAA